MSTDIYRIPGLKLTKAYAYLSDVKDHKQVVPFRRFAGGIGRASQAKQFKTTRGSCSFCSISTLDWLPCEYTGRWPEKSVKFITRLLKNAESNADAKSIDVEDLIIKSIVVQQAPVCSVLVPCCAFDLTIQPSYFAENPPSHIPCPWSYQPLPGSPLPHRNYPYSNWRRSRTKQRQRCCRTNSHWSKQTTGRKEADWGCSYYLNTSYLQEGGALRRKTCHVSMSMFYAMTRNVYCLDWLYSCSNCEFLVNIWKQPAK